jgi:hypothetical protein
MGRSPSITVGDAHEGVRVEHVKSRGLVRLVRWSAGRTQDEAVGLEVSDFCAQLGITTDILGLAPRYLFVGDPGRPGAGHVVALFATEEEARAEFVRFRRAEQAPGAWAEAAEITSDAQMRRICWFASAHSHSRHDASAEHGRRRRAGMRSAIGNWFTGDGARAR